LWGERVRTPQPSASRKRPPGRQVGIGWNTFFSPSWPGLSRPPMNTAVGGGPVARCSWVAGIARFALQPAMTVR
jgi:hypothetical protein